MSLKTHDPAPPADVAAARSAGDVRWVSTPHLPAVHLPASAARQNIASYAHLHGVVLTCRHKPVGTIAPAALCRILREAIEATTEGRRERAETVVRAIAARIAEARGEPLAIPQPALDVLRALTLAARLATAARAGPQIGGRSPWTPDRPAREAVHDHERR